MRLWTLAFHEASTQLGRSAVRATLVAAVVLAMLVVTLNASDFRARQRDYEAQMHARKALTAGERFGWGVVTGLRALRPPSGGSVFVSGIEMSTPAYWDFTADGVKEATVSASLIDGNEIGPLFDLESLIRILMGLLAITLGIDSIAADRARGTLSAILSQPVTRSTVIAGKLLGGTVTLSVAVGLVVLASLGAAWQVLPELGRVALRDPLPALAVVSAVHLVTLYALGMVVGGVILSRGVALTAGMSAWVCAALAAPPLVASSSQLIAPVESRSSAEVRMASTYLALRTETQIGLGKLYVPELERLGYPRLFKAPQWLRDQVESQWRPETESTRKEVDAIEQAWVRQMVTRQQVTERLSWISPSTSYARAAAAVADTGDEFHARFNRAVRDYKDVLNVRLFDDPGRINPMIPGDKPGTYKTEYLDRHLDKRTFPFFKSPSRAQRERWHDSRWTLLALLAHCGLAIAAAAVVFSRRVL